MMGTTRAEVLNPLHLTQLPTAPPLVMSITGLERGLSLCDLLTAAWEDSNYSPQFFEHLAAAFVQRSAIYSAKPSFFVEGALRSHGGADSLHLILDSPTSGPTAIRPTVGRELRTLLGITQEGLYAIPDIAQLSPHPIGLYVKLVKSHRVVQSRPPVRSERGGRGRPGRSRGPSRSSADASETRSTKPLLMVDAAIPQRYQEMVRVTPLMTAAIPPGQRHHVSLNVPYSWTPFSQLSWRPLLMIMRKAWAWMSKRETSSMVYETGLLAGGVLDMGYLILLLPLSVNHWSLANHESTPPLSPLGPETHTPRPTTGTEAECDRLDYHSYRAHALGAPNPRVCSSSKHFTIGDGSRPPIQAKHSAHLVEDDSAEEYYVYRNRALSHQRAPSTHICQLSLPVAPRHTLRPCSPPLLPPRAWEVGTPYSSPRALIPPLASGPPLGNPGEPRFAQPIATIGPQELFTFASAKSAIPFDLPPAGSSSRPSAGEDISVLSAPRIILSSGSPPVPETPSPDTLTAILVDTQC